MQTYNGDLCRVFMDVFMHVYRNIVFQQMGNDSNEVE